MNDEPEDDEAENRVFKENEVANSEPESSARYTVPDATRPMPNPMTSSFAKGNTAWGDRSTSILLRRPTLCAGKNLSRCQRDTLR